MGSEVLKIVRTSKLDQENSRQSTGKSSMQSGLFCHSSEADSCKLQSSPIEATSAITNSSSGGATFGICTLGTPIFRPLPHCVCDM